MQVIGFHFGRGVVSQMEEVAPVDYLYWKERGWLSKDVKFAVSVPVNPLYLAIGKVFESIQRRKSKRVVSAAKVKAAPANQ